MDVTEKIKAGMTREERSMVTEANTALAMGSGTLPVYATPAMTALMEQAAANLAEALLPEGWTSVGISLAIAHKAATPCGMATRAVAEVTAVDGRRIVYRVTAYDGAGEIGSGTHERFEVEKAKFLAKANEKLKNS